MQLARTIDEVILRLDEIIISETAANSNLAYFPVLYRKVTQRIKEGIESNEFENNHRMEVLDVIFANRYINAYQQMKAGSSPTQSWQNAFSEAKNGKLLVMQHLLLGINAHINLDLGVAVAETVGEEGILADFENDFNKINAILASLVDDVQNRIGRISPLFYLLEKVGKGKEDKIVTFSINIARDGAWLFANQYHMALDRAVDLKQRDGVIALLSSKLTTTKSRWLRWTIKSIRWLENKDVKQVVAILNN
ncbi:hypothetical protein G5B37_09340 [Rasiella rasia]|uniref:Uncharacterized protein n=1 Tax=Rasiella rasia TaxID=2744027 RepID=A0A6G6GML1_9FLAO|nr:DUF5995 family protein [Rasiella rasia]QIE59757.1 hypothetical protein G5B37_09340 [Rasiella rasia]